MLSFSKASPPTRAAKPLRIIVADDVPEICQLISQWLGEAGHAIHTAATGRQALRLALGEPSDLIVTDILMPDGDGLDVIMAVKRAQPHTRILCVSGGGKHMSANDALQLAQGIGADGVLLKPFTQKTLLEAVKRVMAPA